LAGDFGGGGFAGAEAVCGELNCFFEGAERTDQRRRGITPNFLMRVPPLQEEYNTDIYKINKHKEAAM
jgi:hypothetical protein